MQRKRFLDKVSRIFLKKVPEMCNFTQKRYQKCVRHHIFGTRINDVWIQKKQQAVLV